MNASLNQTSAYLDACLYACGVLGIETASRHFDRLLRLSEVNTKDELQGIIRSWRSPESRPPAQVLEPAGPWAKGSPWGDAVRIESRGGIIWRLRCKCGTVFTRSTNDTVEPSQRKCDSCQLADELSASRQEVVSRLEATSQIVLAWHRAHDNVIWKRVRSAMSKHGIQDENFAKELHALCWAKIAERAGDYRDQGFRPSAWLGTVASNCIRDHFKVNDNRERLAPTSSLDSEEGRAAVAPATKPEECLPAKAIRPKPHADAKQNLTHRAWDDNWKLV